VPLSYKGKQGMFSRGSSDGSTGKAGRFIRESREGLIRGSSDG
jgi:hypothetical protein